MAEHESLNRVLRVTRVITPRTIRRMLLEIAIHVREDIGKVTEPRAQALFETTAEVLQGLVTAYEHCDRKSEQAWREK